MEKLVIFGMGNKMNDDTINDNRDICCSQLIKRPVFKHRYLSLLKMIEHYPQQFPNLNTPRNIYVT